MESHIQVPYCILKKFAIDRSKLFCLDVNTMQIDRVSPRHLNTELNYYSNVIENALSGIIETPLGRILKDWTNSGDPFIPYNYEKFETAIKAYVYSLIARSPRLFKRSKLKSVYLQFMPETDQHDFILGIGMDLLSQNHFLTNYGISLLINNTETPFVITMNGLIKLQDAMWGEIYIVPMRPDLALMIIEHAESIVVEESQEKEVRMMFEADENQIRLFNQRAACQQKQMGYGFVASGDKNVIESLRGIL